LEHRFESVQPTLSDIRNYGGFLGLGVPFEHDGPGTLQAPGGNGGRVIRNLRVNALDRIDQDGLAISSAFPGAGSTKDEELAVISVYQEGGGSFEFQPGCQDDFLWDQVVEVLLF
jgi:hypothetical protein